MGALVIKVFENNEIYKLIVSFLMGKPICFKFFFQYTCPFIQLYTETDAFIQ